MKNGLKGVRKFVTIEPVMDFDVDDDQDLCKNCNHQSYNDAPYGQD